MKKLLVVSIVLVLLAASTSVALATPWNNPTGYWVYDVDCGSGETFDVWVPSQNSAASFDEAGNVGIMKALYIDFGDGYELVWQVSGKGVYKNTIWCEWEFEGLQVAGDVLVPPVGR